MAQITEFRMKLSDRMQVIANHVEAGETVADIGTDHGQIPVWLFARGICPSAILTDISQGSLSKAKETAAAYQFGSGLDFRAGDGLAVLAPAEVDTVIIAGMGGKLIRQILDTDPAHSLTFRKYVLQPRKGAGHLRKWLLEHGFQIISEDVVREGHFLPEIITCRSPGAPQDLDRPDLAGLESDGRKKNGDDRRGFAPEDLALDARDRLKVLDPEDIRLRVPPWMIQAQGPVEEYLALRIGQEEEILENLGRARVQDPAVRARVRENIRYLQGLRQLHQEMTRSQAPDAARLNRFMRQNKSE